jgi:hypothetical protein
LAGWLLQYAVASPLPQLPSTLLLASYLLPQANVLTFAGQLCPVEFSPPALLHQVWFAVTDTA